MIISLLAVKRILNSARCFFLLIVISAGALSVAGHAYGLLGEPRLSSEDKPITRKEEIKASHLIILDFELGKHTLKEVEAKLGKNQGYFTKNHRTGVSVCYLSNRPGDTTKIIFWIDDHSSRLLMFTLLSGNFPLKGSERCTPSSSVHMGLSTTNGLKLGMTQEQARTILGSPSKMETARLLYLYETQRETSRPKGDPNEGPLNVYTTTKIELVFKNSEAIALEVSRSETV